MYPFKKLDLSVCQAKGLELLTHSTDNIFLTGSAGTGKTFLIREFCKSLDSKTFPIVASTGAAAILVHGRTFHSFFSLGIMEGGVEECVQKELKNKRLISRLKKIDGVNIDEISMIA